MASEEEFDSADEAAGEFLRGPHQTPKGADPKTEAAVIAWVRSFGGSIAKKGYERMLIAGGYDDMTLLNFTEAELLTLHDEPGIKGTTTAVPFTRPHARRMVEAATELKMRQLVATAPKTTAAPATAAAVPPAVNVTVAPPLESKF